MMMLKSSAAIVLLATVWYFTVSAANVHPAAASLSEAEKRLCSESCTKVYVKTRDTCLRDVCNSTKTFVRVPFDDDDTPEPTYTPCEEDCFKKAGDAQLKCEKECV